jgi:hypothetical protein
MRGMKEGEGSWTFLGTGDGKEARPILNTAISQITTIR